MKGTMIFKVLLSISIMGWVISVNALTVPVSSSLDMEANADAGAGLVTDTDSDSQGATVNPLSVSVSALAINGGASVLATGDGVATWDDPAKGQVLLANIGWDITSVTSGSAVLFNGSDWTYTFTADKTGFFTLDFDVTAAGSDIFGLNGFNFDWIGGPGGGAFFSTNTNGTITRPIVAGNNYTVNINNQANIFGGLGTRDALMYGTFDWSMDTVREIEVAIDIKFCSNPNAHNCNSGGVLPVTIFGSLDLDVSDIDLESLQLCRDDNGECTDPGLFALDEGDLRDWSFADRGDPTLDLGTGACERIDTDGDDIPDLDIGAQDGFTDLDVAFDKRAVSALLDICDGGQKGDASVPLFIQGSLFDGTLIFSVPIPDIGVDQLVKKNR